jgi:hypothetical protein
MPKHFFNTNISVEGYRKPKVDLDQSTRVGRKLGQYGFRQGSLTFYTPLLTRVFAGKDGTVKNYHLLLTGTYVSLRPEFQNLPVHNLVKSGIGVRFIYNTGKKAVWFVDASPFVTRDRSFPSTLYRRFASTIILSINESASFNWRVGITKSFMWGNRYYLPYLGVRIGRLDKINLSIQIPRNIQLSVPVTRSFVVSAFTRPQGGMYIFSNAESVYFMPREKTFHFTRLEIISGLRIDVRFKQYGSLFVSGGVSNHNNLTFYSEHANSKIGMNPYHVFFYSENTKPTTFFSAGLTVRFGRTRTYVNDRNMYDAIDMVNDGGHNLQIPLQAKQRSRQNVKDIRDLVDYNDL